LPFRLLLAGRQLLAALGGVRIPMTKQEQWCGTTLCRWIPVTPSPAMRAELARKLVELERQKERAAVLDVKLGTLIGHTAADMGARGLITDWDAPMLQALGDLVPASIKREPRRTHSRRN
jgi:hypothetical protein